jgi:hypothetical protein
MTVAVLMLVPLCILETDLGQVIATLREWLVPVSVDALLLAYITRICQVGSLPLSSCTWTAPKLPIAARRTPSLSWKSIVVNFDHHLKDP